jgi:3D (Asp-Asp-Asp) domain-containing protein
MLMNRIVCLLSTTLLFTFPVESNISPFLPTEQSIENKVDDTGMVQYDRFGMVKHPFEVQYEKDKEETNKIKKQKQEEGKKENEPEWQEFILTFYSSLNCENGFGNKTCTGEKLYDGLVASNYYRLNTRIQLEGWGEVTVGDRGSDRYFNNDYRLDVYIPKEQGESDSHYFKRVNNMGKIKVKGYIVK